MVKKSTHDSYDLELFAPIMKSVEGNYIAVLSDNSVDRDDEVISKSCIEKLGKDIGYIAGLVDHENSVLKMVAEWVNRRVVEIDGHVALVAEPKFFKSNPNAKIIKGMLDEGATIGISIGAMVKDKEYDPANERNVYKELELLEASFVAVPSNRHGRAMRVAKSFDSKSFFDKENNKLEEKNMELTQKDIDSAVDKAVLNVKEDTIKQLEAKDSELSKLKKELEDKESDEEKEKEKEESEKELEDSKKSLEDSEKKLKAAEEALEVEKKKALEKSSFSQGDKTSPEDVEKAFTDGKLPIMKMGN